VQPEAQLIAELDLLAAHDACLAYRCTESLFSVTAELASTC
jgi:hypothetical protein